MTEFAFSGIGINPHFGTPRSPWKRDEGHIPGGSSSGAAVSVADGMALAALGTDTGGSCRIPAAFCGVVGYKPTQRRVPNTGVLPLSPSLDSVGPLANSVACCAAIDAVLAGEPLPAVKPMDAARVAAGGAGQRGDGEYRSGGGRGVQPGAEPARQSGRAHHPPHLPAIRGDRGGEQPGRVCGGRGAYLAPRVSGRPGRDL